MTAAAAATQSPPGATSPPITHHPSPSARMELSFKLGFRTRQLEQPGPSTPPGDLCSDFPFVIRSCCSCFRPNWGNDFLVTEYPEQPSVASTMNPPTYNPSGQSYSEEIHRIEEEIQDIDRLIAQKEKECEVLFLHLIRIVQSVLYQKQQSLAT
ncbi:GM23007 [Drosophila sechellia]|uniref:GM23007 n=1 Tax=Drosophila sechellia TaxID=7238 RepID=B4I7E6_DROSE|nr:GM23007 [Drosophila sechellia]